MLIGYSGKDSALAKSFILQYKKKFKFKCFKFDISNQKKFQSWLYKNRDINVFINFAALTSKKECEKNKKKALKVNYLSVINMINNIQNIKLKNFKYFLCLSTSHVFKKSLYKLRETSEKKPSNYYGISKKKMEDYVLLHQQNYYFKIGIARIFNFYNKLSTKSFFINDVIKRLNSNKKTQLFNQTNTYRDFLNISDINSALYLMILNNLNNDYNICSGNGVNLQSIVKILAKNKNVKIIFDKKKSKHLVGSNLKLKKFGWRVKKPFKLYDFNK